MTGAMAAPWWNTRGPTQTKVIIKERRPARSGIAVVRWASASENQFGGTLLCDTHMR